MARAVFTSILEKLILLKHQAIEARNWALAASCLLLYRRIRSGMQEMDSYRFNNWVRRTSILYPSHAQWSKIKDRHEDSAYVSMMRVDVPVFRDMLHFVPEAAWYKRRPWLRHPAGWGAHRVLHRPRQAFFLGADDVLALALFWLASTCDLRHLALVFGLSMTCVERDLRDGQDILLAIVDDMPDAEVRWPTFVQQYNNALTINVMYGPMPPEHPVNAFAWADGLRTDILVPTDGTERLFYNAKNKRHEVNSVFATEPQEGTICWARVNEPGRLHDMRLAAELIAKIRDPRFTMRGYTILCDPGFKGAQDALCTRKDMLVAGLSRSVRQKINAAMTSRRQPAEWLMRVIQSLWKRVRLPLHRDAAERLRVFQMVVGMHNVVARRMGNQIRTVLHEIQMRPGVRDALL